MKRTVSVVLAASLLSSILPPFVPMSWSKIQPIEWEPAPWPGLNASVIEAPAPISVDEIKGAIGNRILNDETGVQARFMTVPGAAELNDSVRQTVYEAIAISESNSGQTYYPQAHSVSADLRDRDCINGTTLLEPAKLLKDPKFAAPGGAGVTVVCDIVSAVGPILGQRIRTIESNGAEILSDKNVIVYQNTLESSSFTATELWNDGAGQYFWDTFLAVMKREQGSIGLSWVSGAADEDVTAQALASAVMTQDGAVIVTLPAGVVSPELLNIGIEKTEAPVSVRLPFESIGQILSEAGTKAVAAASSGGPYQAPPYVWAGHDSIDCKLTPCVSLTYDDGPATGTPEILDALAAYHASATFYVLGALVEVYPETVARAYAEGHLVHNHTWTHRELTLIGLEEVAVELKETDSAISDVTGEMSTTFRPPYGSVNDEILSIAGLPAILWDVDTNDWQAPPGGVLIDRAVDDAWPGSIVLQHDIHKVTVDTVWNVLEGLHNRGFSMVNVEQLFGGEIPAGIVRANY